MAVQRTSEAQAAFFPTSDLLISCSGARDLGSVVVNNFRIAEAASFEPFGRFAVKLLLLRRFGESRRSYFASRLVD